MLLVYWYLVVHCNHNNVAQTMWAKKCCDVFLQPIAWLQLCKSFPLRTSLHFRPCCLYRHDLSILVSSLSPDLKRVLGHHFPCRAFPEQPDHTLILFGVRPNPSCCIRIMLTLCICCCRVGAVTVELTWFLVGGHFCRSSALCTWWELQRSTAWSPKLYF